MEHQAVSIAVSLLLTTFIHSLALRSSALALRLRELFTLKRCVAYAIFSSVLLQVLRPLLGGAEASVSAPTLFAFSLVTQAAAAAAFYALLLGELQRPLMLDVAKKGAALSSVAVLLLTGFAALFFTLVNASIDDPAAAAAAIHGAPSPAAAASSP